jgi:hypothetical protein
MLIIVSRFWRKKRQERNLSCPARGQILEELRTEDTDKWAWAENFQFLQDAIDRPERGFSRRNKSSDLSAEAAKLRDDMPTRLAQNILLQFFRADTTELREDRILEMYPENSFAVQAALTELCNHSLLAVAQSARAGKLYVVTLNGQSLCCSCRTKPECLCIFQGSLRQS